MSRNYLWTAALWLMVPVTLVTGIPRSGCICTSGQFAHYCNRNESCCKPVDGNAPTRTRCACCRKSRSAAAERSAAERSTARKSGACRPVRREGHCKRLAVNLIVSLVLLRVHAPQADAWGLSSGAAAGLLAPAGVAAHLPAHNPDLPVPDLVIAHQILLI